MSSKDTPPLNTETSETDTRLIESLLEEVYHPEISAQKNEQRIQALMSTIAQEPKSTRALHASPSWRMRWLSLAIAASLLVAVTVSLLSFGTSNQAYAAVDKVLEATPTIRAYEVTMVRRRPLAGDRETKANLYLDEHDNFVLQLQSLRGAKDVWIGGDAARRWLIPNVGPAFIGNEALVGSWLFSRDVPSPFLHIPTALERMRRAYRLQLHEAVDFQLSGNAPGLDRPRCNHVIGKLRTPHHRFPSKIEFWSDINTNQLYKLVLNWDRDAYERGPLTCIIEYRDPPKIDAQWFTIQGHLESNRRLIEVTQANDLPDNIEGIQAHR